MQCISDEDCPALQICHEQLCEHTPLYMLTPQTVMSIFILPILMILSNRVGMPTIWVIYPIIMVLMAYSYREAGGVVAPVAFAGGLVALAMGIGAGYKKQGGSGNGGAGAVVETRVGGNQGGSGSIGNLDSNRQSLLTNSSGNSTSKPTPNLLPTATTPASQPIPPPIPSLHPHPPHLNFYLINITLPILVLGTNLGLVLAQIVPFLYIGIVGILVLLVCMVLSYWLYKDMKAGELIEDGHFRRMLPDRIKQNSPLRLRGSLNIQLAEIQQSDRQIQQFQKQKQLPPTIKKKARQQHLTEQSHFPTNQFLISLLSFLAYECLCMSLSPLLRWLGMQSTGGRLAITYGVLLLAVIGGEVGYYWVCVERVRVEGEAVGVRMGLGVLGDGGGVGVVGNIGMLGGVVLVGSFLEGFIGFGFFYLIFLYLLYKKSPLSVTIPTCSYFPIFLASIFSLNSIFCGKFHTVTYISVLLLLLGVCAGCQYLFNAYLDRNMGGPTTDSKDKNKNKGESRGEGKGEGRKEGSWLIVLVMIVEVVCLVAVAIAIGLVGKREGAEGLVGVGALAECW